MDPELRKIIESLLNDLPVDGKYIYEQDHADHYDCQCCGATIYTHGPYGNPGTHGKHDPDCAIQALRKYMKDK